MKEKALELKQTIELIKQNTYETKNKTKHNTESTNYDKGTADNERRTDTKNGNIRGETKKQIYRK